MPVRPSINSSVSSIASGAMPRARHATPRVILSAGCGAVHLREGDVGRGMALAGDDEPTRSRKRDNNPACGHWVAIQTASHRYGACAPCSGGHDCASDGHDLAEYRLGGFSGPACVLASKSPAAAAVNYAAASLTAAAECRSDCGDRGRHVEAGVHIFRFRLILAAPPIGWTQTRMFVATAILRQWVANDPRQWGANNHTS
jgi:hypothetical protein